MGNRLMIEDDQVQFWMTDDRLKDYLQFLNMLYSERLLDRNIFTQEEANFIGNIESGNIGMLRNQTIDDTVQEHYIGISPIEGPYGEPPLQHSAPIARDFGAFAITSSNQYPHETIRWIDHFYGEEGSIFYRYGVEGETFYYQDDGLPEYLEEYFDDGGDIGDFTPWPGGGAPQYVTDRNASAINSLETQEAQKMLDPYMVDIYGPPMFDEETSREVDRLRQDIDVFFDESITRFITGDLSFDQWDEYVSTLENMGLHQLEQIYQEAYDSTYKE